MKPSLRAAVIAEWRGLPERRMRADRWQLPAELVPKMMQRLGLRERLHETEVIETLLQPALHYELEQISKKDILRKLKTRFGGKIIRDVRFRVG